MWRNPARMDLRRSLDELLETMATNRKLRAELRQLMQESRGTLACCSQEPENSNRRRQVEPFAWWECEDPNE
jgi:predicted component of type VI protein secretion system